jgi:phosphate uptake regulator
MKRKIIKLGQATFVASLPSKWVRKFSLKQGDYLELEEKGGSLIFTSEKTKEVRSISLDFTTTNTKLARGYLETAYDLGFEEIEVIHNQVIDKYKEDAKSNTAEYIQGFVNNRFVGSEIVEQSNKRTVIKDLGGVREDSAEQVFNRTLFMLKSLAEDCLTALKENDKEKLRGAQTKFENIRKFILYYKRLISLSRMEEKEYKFRNRLAVHLNNINSGYRVIARETLNGGCTYSADALDFVEAVNKHLYSTINLCLKFNKEKALGTTEERAVIWKMLHKIRPKGKDYIVIFTLGGIIGSTSNIVRDMLGLEL